LAEVSHEEWEKMKKSTILIAILLLSVFLIPTTMAFQQLVKTPHINSAQSSVNFNTAPCGGVVQPCGPGSGGGGEGTI
jgi:hypothetical protein